MKLGYVIVYVPNVVETVDFYERAFGLARRFVHDSGQYAEMETGFTALAFAAEDFVRGNGLEFTPMHLDHLPAAMEISLITDDVSLAVTRAIDSGAVAVKRPEQKPWGQVVAYVRDLNGTLIELCTRVG